MPCSMQHAACRRTSAWAATHRAEGHRARKLGDGVVGRTRRTTLQTTTVHCIHARTHARTHMHAHVSRAHADLLSIFGSNLSYVGWLVPGFGLARQSPTRVHVLFSKAGLQCCSHQHSTAAANECQHTSRYRASESGNGCSLVTHTHYGDNSTPML